MAALVGVGKTTIGEIERGKDCRTW
ncbi:MAG: hypothetical protein ACLUIX_05205 [Oscillospiraceae bacterium]